MFALLNWLLILLLCVAIARYAPPAGMWASTSIMAAITAVASPYVEQQLGVSWIALAAVAGIILFLTGFDRFYITTKVNTAGRH